MHRFTQQNAVIMSYPSISILENFDYEENRLIFFEVEEFQKLAFYCIVWINLSRNMLYKID